MKLQHNINPGQRPYLKDRHEQLSQLSWERIRAERISPCLGAEISGVDLSKPLDTETFDEVRAALLAYRVIFFRDQDITAQQHMDFAKRFGELEEHPFIPSDAPDAEVVRFDKDEKAVGVENLWHSDVSWREIPSLGSILRAHIVPEIGGDTLFADMVAAYECLDEETKALIEGKSAVNDFTQSFGVFLRPEELAEQQKRFPAVEHPLVRTSPDTGEKSLYANGVFTSHIVGMDRQASDTLLGRLFLEAAVPEYQCRFKWRKDSIAFWDNRVVQHYAANDYWPQRRQMDRVTIIGDRPR
ncbi:taurine dioxygenase [Halieaceae bacterium IMCC14734]|uniref:Taurine dioxygenase n=1 Tax=Candidatus Litorirhabdus singularis TaxID=2518993 RepID=A0ABT3TEH3_9GAMM|nr:TauD/TfdA family dioxygenase [Candidatus Litorirhabdus singularis]MCX2980580.1 taurine dioxygenase [Candidatus Litorirhabdus singularis]